MSLYPPWRQANTCDNKGLLNTSAEYCSMPSLAVLLLVASTALSDALPMFHWPIQIDETLAISLTEGEMMFASLVRASLRANTSEETTLEDILFSADERTSVRLYNLHLISKTSLKMVEVVPDLSLLNLAISFRVGQLDIRGDCGDHDRGNISVTLKDTLVSGIIGLTLDGDTFQALNVELLYDPQEVAVKVFYKRAEGEMISEEFLSDSVIGSLAQPFFSDLTYQFDKLFERKLTAILAELPINSILADPEAVTSFKGYAEELSETLNNVADSLLDIVRADMKNNGHILVEDFHQDYDQHVGEGVKMRVGFQAERGWFESLTSIQRNTDVTVVRNQSSFTVSFKLILRTMDVGYEVRFQGSSLEGQVKGHVGVNTFSFKTTLDIGGGGCVTSLCELRLGQFGDVRVELFELGELEGLSSRIISRIIGQLKGSVLHDVELKLTNSVAAALDLFHCAQNWSR
uniref:Uncharacterized protein n=1 Tax=Timema poppense TaxID=170557 RepID=A0A7R9GVM8_TIMPO|nr:unnamed protein product [Timema poppensis]